MPRDDAELRKSITAALIDTTAPIVVFDNLAGTVKSPVLDSLLTTKTWTDRWLGQNKSVTAPNDRLWLATGNNAQFGGDLGRRLAMVRLDPPTANHHLRTDFQIENLHGWMETHRGEYIAALLTIARGWINTGRPSEKARSDGFAQWIAGIRGLMAWAVFEGTFGGSFDAEAMTEEDEEWHAWLVELHGFFGEKVITVKDIVAEMNPPGRSWDLNGNPFMPNIDPEKLPGDLTQRWVAIHDGKDMAFRKALGKWLMYRQGRFVSKWQLGYVGQNGNTKAQQYYVKPPAGWK
jgi:hypothetical protein